MEDTILAEVLTEVRGLRSEVAEWRQEMGERLAITETKVTDLYGNGQAGRVSKLESRLTAIERIRWKVTGILVALWAVVTAASSFAAKYIPWTWFHAK
jgi:hypothetical protein